jgi:phospholipase/lecithinase/hemolysin
VVYIEKRNFNSTFQNRLHGAGIESFLILNVPPVDKAPGGGGKPALTTNIATYNSILFNYTMAFAKNHTESNVFFVDTNTIFNSILANASSYGFKNTTSFCPNYDAPDFNTNYQAYGCLAPYEYFWYSKYCTLLTIGCLKHKMLIHKWLQILAMLLIPCINSWPTRFLTC